MEQSDPQFFTQYKERLFSYVNNVLLLAKLQVASKTSKLMSMMLIWAVVAILCCLVVLFGSFCAAYYFSDLFDSNMKGFGLVAIIYVVVTLIVLLTGKNLIRKFILNQIVNIIFEKTANDDNGDEDAKN